INTNPEPVRQLRPEVPNEVSELVSRLMRTDPADRYPSARAVVAALTGLGHWLSTGETIRGVDVRSARERVMVIDDDPGIRHLMGALLADQCDVVEVADANAALLEITRQLPQLVVVDVHLPDTNGAELVTQIRKVVPRSAGVKVLLVSGEISTEALSG